jgi:acyl-CoA thioester hydrolase
MQRASPEISHTITIRVRYPECDSMSYLHHSRFLQYFEMGRIELLRSLGHDYAALERDGVFFAVVKAEVNYRAPAKFDDELTLLTRVVKQTHVRFDHIYELRRGSTLVADAKTTIACVDRNGELIKIPESLSRTREQRIC